VVFDKTGTLTAGRIALQETITLRDGAGRDALDVAAALEAGAQHPVGQALRQAAAPAVPASDVVRTPGQGVEGQVAGVRYRLGQPEFTAVLHGQPLPPPLRNIRPDQMVVALSDARGWIAAFLLADAPREGAIRLVADLRELGLEIVLLSGDRAESVRHWAGLLGIAAAEGGASPARKREAIAELQGRGAIVAMVGDGANDSAALGVAHVSIALGGGARLAQTGADMIWLGDDLAGLARSVRMARRTMRIVRQNLTWAFFYNITFIPLAVAGHIGPWLAGLGMSASSLFVVMNALRLLRGPGVPSAPVRTGAAARAHTPAETK
jgi:Cu2+-exporting ATPase